MKYQSWHASEIENLNAFIKTYLCLEDGSVLNCRNIVNDLPNFVYNEITGYQLSIMLMQWQLYKNKCLDKEIFKTVNYLKSQVVNGNRFQHGTTLEGIIDARYCVFDNCIILQSLITYYIIFKDDQILKLCNEIANWILSMQEHDGSFKSRQLNDQATYSVDTFEADFSCINIKSIIPLLRLYNICGNDKLIASVYRSLSWAEELQDKRSGLFYATSNKSHHFMHAHCYAMEGLQYFAVHQKNSKVDDMLEKGINGLVKLQKRFGAIPHTWAEHRSFKKQIRFILDFGLAVDASVQARKLIHTYSILNSRNDFDENIYGLDCFIRSQYEKFLKTKYKGTIGYRKHLHKIRNRQHSDLNAWPTQFLLGMIYLQDKFTENDDIGKTFLDINWM
jgi:CII-binding regulator of phage lambda lysogenization HflD